MKLFWWSVFLWTANYGSIGQSNLRRKKVSHKVRLSHTNSAGCCILQRTRSVQSALWNSNADFLQRKGLPYYPNCRCQVCIGSKYDGLVESVFICQLRKVHSNVNVTFFFFMPLPFMF